MGVRLSAPSGRGDGSAGLEGLSEREREIVELAAEGRSNKEVAATLFLSAKTIEHHLSRAYRKLGVRSRVELASLVAHESETKVARAPKACDAPGTPQALVGGGMSGSPTPA